MSNEKTVAVIGDLTALYSARKKYRKQINYERLDSVLKKSMGVDNFDVSMWYTLYSAYNEEQASFVQGLKDLGWEIETLSPRNIHHRIRPEYYRFDARIAYQLGLAVGEHSKVLVVSDSFELMGALRDLHNDDSEIDVNLAFFSEALDSRWWRVLNDDESFVRFIDLDTELYD